MSAPRPSFTPVPVEYCRARAASRHAFVRGMRRAMRCSQHQGTHDLTHALLLPARADRRLARRAEHGELAQKSKSGTHDSVNTP